MSNPVLTTNDHNEYICLFGSLFLFLVFCFFGEIRMKIITHTIIITAIYLFMNNNNNECSIDDNHWTMIIISYYYYIIVRRFDREL